MPSRMSLTFPPAKCGFCASNSRVFSSISSCRLENRSQSSGETPLISKSPRGWLTSRSRNPEFTRQLVVIDVLDVFPRPQHLEVLQRLPTLSTRVVCGVEHDAVAMQVRIKGARRVVTKHGAHDVTGGPVGNVAPQCTRVPRTAPIPAPLPERARLWASTMRASSPTSAQSKPTLAGRT
jgi:hypothetical protein